METDSLGGCFGRLVDVGSVYGSAGCSRVLTADCVVEENDLMCAWDVVQEQFCHFGVVDFLYFVVCVEGVVGCGCGGVVEDLDGIFVEGVVCL